MELAELREKMSRGEWVPMNAPALSKAKSRARTLAETLNHTSEAEPDLRREVIEKLLGYAGEALTIKPPFHCDYGFNIRMGARSLLNFDCVILDVAEVEIGDDTLIGPQVGIYTVEHPMDPDRRKEGWIRGKAVRIGRNVWIGGGAKILPGVSIGDNAVIGAGAVVASDIPDRAVAVGTPARVIRFLGENED